MLNPCSADLSRCVHIPYSYSMIEQILTFTNGLRNVVVASGMDAAFAPHFSGSQHRRNKFRRQRPDVLYLS